MEASDLDSGTADQDDDPTDRYFDRSFDDESQARQQIGARRGRPKPTVACPWPKTEKEQRLQEIQALIAKLPPDEIAKGN